MSANQRVIKCGKCGNPLNESANVPLDARKPCPRCGSKTREFNVVVNTPFAITADIGMKGYHKGKKKAFVEDIIKHVFSHIKRKMTKLYRLIHRDNDLYREKVVDPDTGEVIHFCEEKLSDHKGHGSAKKK